MCCHPEIPPDARVALSLKIIGGFSVREIARAFLCDDAAIAQRIVRAKRQIRERQLTLDLPGPPKPGDIPPGEGGDLAHRLDSVLDVIYLMFNEGYSAHDGATLIRQDLCFEALRLGRIVAASPLAEPRVHALVALMALQAARFPARVDTFGDLVPLEEQDRRQWDERLIAIGFRHFDRSMAGERVSPFHVQAAIAATYARALSDEAVDWRVVLDLYDQLLAIHPSPIVMLNRAVAVSRVQGAAAGLAALDPLDNNPMLRYYHLLMSVRGQLLLEVGRPAEARAAFEAALACECSDPERRFLERKLTLC
jgi:RNA polymerase sigma-70 factor (ECF subfamily)